MLIWSLKGSDFNKLEAYEEDKTFETTVIKTEEI